MKPENLLLKHKHTCQGARCTMGNLRCVDFGSAAVLENGRALLQTLQTLSHINLHIRCYTTRSLPLGHRSQERC